MVLPIAELLTVITILAIMLPAAAAVREKERGTIEQLLISPLTPVQILLPKVISMTLVILAGTAASLFLILVPVFQVPIKGSLLLFFAVTTLYTVATSGLGLYISTLSRNLAQAAMLAIFVLLPMVFLSGAWTPPEAMPAGLRQAMTLSPLYYFIEMGYGILLKGAGRVVGFAARPVPARRGHLWLRRPALSPAVRVDSRCTGTTPAPGSP